MSGSRGENIAGGYTSFPSSPLPGGAWSVLVATQLGLSSPESVVVPGQTHAELQLEVPESSFHWPGRLLRCMQPSSLC